MEQQAADVVPALRQLGGLLVVARPALDAICLVVLVVGGRLEHIQIRPVGVRHVRHHTDALARRRQRCIRLAAKHTVDHGNCLGASNRITRAEVGRSRNPALCYCGLHSIIRPMVCRHVGKGVLRTDICMRETGQNRNELRAGNGLLRAERAVRIAVHQRKAGHLVYCVGIPGVIRHVGKRIVCAASTLHQQAGEQLAGFCAGDGGIRAEGAVCIAVHILHMLGGIERGCARLRRTFCSGCAGRNRQRTRCHQRREHRGSDLSFHKRILPSVWNVLRG